MKNGFIIFTRLPIPGQTKTRLQKCLTEEQCAELHRNILKDLNETSKKINADIFISYTPNGDTSILSEIFTIEKNMFPQKGTNIWYRMNDSMTRVFDMGYDRVVLVGADIPELSYHHINKSFNKLDECDVILTPTKDRGYCLIGSKRPINEVFEIEDINNDKSVFENTVNLANNAGYRVISNSELIDLDEYEDLCELVSSEEYRKYRFDNTLEYLIKLGYER